jgi:hypothetical protein
MPITARGVPELEAVVERSAATPASVRTGVDSRSNCLSLQARSAARSAPANDDRHRADRAKRDRGRAAWGRRRRSEWLGQRMLELGHGARRGRRGTQEELDAEAPMGLGCTLPQFKYDARLLPLPSHPLTRGIASCPALYQIRYLMLHPLHLPTDEISSVARQEATTLVVPARVLRRSAPVVVRPTSGPSIS